MEEFLEDDAVITGGFDTLYIGENEQMPLAPIRTYKNDHSLAATKDAIIANLIPATVSECALYTKRDTVCSEPKTIAAIANVLAITEKQGGEILTKAKEKTNCTTEKCVLKKLEPKLGTQLVRGELTRNFKIDGPVDTSLLNNFHIDDTLQQWKGDAISKTGNFFPYHFNMKNYASYSYVNNHIVNSPDTLATIGFDQVYAQGFRCCGCVINSDEYQGRGKHWMALFADTRTEPWTVEFFNSSGNTPAPEWVNWMVKTKMYMESLTSNKEKANVELVRVTAIRQQQSKTECGVYSLFYIWARLNNVPVDYFVKTPIPDQLMFEFRHHLFSDSRYKAIKKFNWDEYKRQMNVTWE